MNEPAHGGAGSLGIYIVFERLFNRAIRAVFLERCFGSNDQAVPMAWLGTPYDLLKSDQITRQGEAELAKLIKDLVEAEP